LGSTNPARVLYDHLPAEVRGAFRSLLPRELLRWYAHKNTDVYLISYPKCGRTWLRLMIGRAIGLHYSLPEDEELLFLRWKKRPHPDLPRITVVHEDRPMLKTPDELETNKEKYRHKRVIFLVRDPRDVIVSSYFEMKKRGHIFGNNPHETRLSYYDGSLSEFIDRPIGGFDTLLCYYNIWANSRDIPQGFLLVRYEDMKSNPNRELRRVLDFLGLQSIDDDAIAEAVKFASFENMRKMEAKGTFTSGMLNPADRNDSDSFKTRKGKISGYLDYLSEPEIWTLNNKMKKELSQIFGYTNSF
jgi:hypothetical protein